MNGPQKNCRSIGRFGSTNGSAAQSQDSLLQFLHENHQKKILPHRKDFSLLVTVSFTHAAHYKADDEN